MQVMRLARTLGPAAASTLVIVALFVSWRLPKIGVSLAPGDQLLVTDAAPDIAEFRARLLWAVSAVILVALIAWNAVLALTILYRHAQSRLRLLVGVAVVEALILVAFLASWDIDGRSSDDLIRTAIFSKTKLPGLDPGPGLGVRPSNRRDSHIASRCALGIAVIDLGDGRVDVSCAPERERALPPLPLRRRGDTA
jgi:hypothetical protein